MHILNLFFTLKNDTISNHNSTRIPSSFYTSIVIEGKEMVPPVDLVYLEKIIKNISNRNFTLKLISVDAECFKLSVDMYFYPKISLVACTGQFICRNHKSNVNNRPGMII